jgi:uncharacterized lipoprotein YehR (DUF1307 family)
MLKYCLLAVFLFIQVSCQRSAKDDQAASDIVRKIVMVRTEGLAIAEVLWTYSEDPAVRQISKQIIEYYKSTHPTFLRICKGRSLMLNEQDYRNIWTNLENKIDYYDPQIEQKLLALSMENTTISIELYSSLIRNQRWHDIAVFSFEALPELFNIAGGLEQELSFGNSI